MHKRPWTLRQRIYVFAASIMLMILLVGGLFAFAALHTVQSYQQIMLQITNLQQIKAQVSEVTEIVRNRVVNGEENAPQCLSAWEDLGRRINGLDFTDNTAIRLLVQDLQVYHQQTWLEYLQLIQNVPPGTGETADMQELYRTFLLRQDDQQFLCDQLLKLMSDYMADNYAGIVRRSTVSLAAFAAMLLCLLLLTGSFSMVLAENVNRPVRRLTDQAQELMRGNYQMEDLPVIQHDEIGQLTEAFNTMKNRVRENFQAQEELWRLESLLRDAEFRALQSQVNPHFLFNVLSAATESALMEGADHTVDIIENISRMLHYSLTSVRDESWLSDELKMAQSYIYLQTERFGDRIAFSYEVPQEVPMLRTPGMTLQPILENAVKHGVEHLDRGGRIRVFMEQMPEAVILCVEDNGRGIPPEKVALLNQGAAIAPETASQQAQRSTGLGVANVYGRMKTFYKQEGLLRMESQEGHGTRVYLKYLKQEEPEHASRTDHGR